MNTGNDTGIDADEQITIKESYKSATTIESDYISSTTSYITRESQYLSIYSQSAVFKKIPDISNCLSKTAVDYHLRARIIDWMVEVLYKIHNEMVYTYIFRSILILDLYLKHSDKLIEPKDIELIGITSIYLACKYESTNCFTASFFCNHACHNKYTEFNIFETEVSILKTLRFTLKHTTYLDLLYAYLCYYFDVAQIQFDEIKTLCSFFLLQCIIDIRFINVSMTELCLCIIIVGIQSLFSGLIRQAFNVSDDEKMSFLAAQEKILIKTIIHNQYISKCNFNTVNAIRMYLMDFNRDFKECTFILSLLRYDYEND